MRITLAAGESKTVTVGGSRFYYEIGLGSINVKTIGNDAVEYDLNPGMGFKNNPDQVNFFGVQIKNNESFSQTITFIISYKDVFDNRVTFGNELPVFDDSGLIKVNRGQAFFGMWDRTAQAGTMPAVALRNVEGSGKNLYVSKVFISTPVAMEVFLMRSTNMELDEATPTQVSIVNKNYPVINKNVKGPNSTAAKIDVFNVLAYDLPNSARLAVINLPANGHFVWEFKEPVKLESGAGLWVNSQVVASKLGATFELLEESV